MTTDDQLSEIADYVSIRRLLERYADVMTRRAYPELHEIMRPVCPFLLDTGSRQVTFGGPADMEAIVPRALERYDIVQLILLNTNAVIDSERGTAAARTYVHELRTLAENGRRADLYAVYHDRFERDEGGRWWLVRRFLRPLSRSGEEPGDPDLMNMGTPTLPLDDPDTWEQLVAAGDW